MFPRGDVGAAEVCLNKSPLHHAGVVTACTQVNAAAEGGGLVQASSPELQVFDLRHSS